LLQQLPFAACCFWLSVSLLSISAVRSGTAREEDIVLGPLLPAYMQSSGVAG